ncbi:MAG: hypothetical protein AB7I52_19805 [Rhizobiaceae bacterium]
MTMTSTKPAIRETLPTRLQPARAVERTATLPVPGPFEPTGERPARGNDMVRAVATGMLVMYPVAAIVVAVVATSLLLGLGAPA